MPDNYTYDVPQGITLSGCIQGDKWKPAQVSPPHKFGSQTSFDIPLSSHALLNMARGQEINGKLHVLTSTAQAASSAKVNVVIQYDQAELRDQAKACIVTRNDGGNGVGLFTPVWTHDPGRAYTVVYEITVTLPEVSSGSAPLVINNFETNMTNGSQLLDSLDGKVVFNSLTLNGSNAEINADSLTATNGTLKTSAGLISGRFYTTGKLVFDTSKSAISASVVLESKNGSSPSFVANTSKGKIETDISLLSDSGSGGTFAVTLNTSEAPVNVTFPASPADSKLALSVDTSKDSATVSLNDAYEGKFTLNTSKGTATVDQNPGAQDPTGQGRKRTVNITTSKGDSAIGNIYWGDKESKNGSVTVNTSKGNVTLGVRVTG